jgi:hypothetical protein
VAPRRVRGAGEDEEEVGEPVQVHDRQPVDDVDARRADRLALRAAADGARHVEPGRSPGPPGQDETPELGEVGVEAVTVGLESVDLRLGHAQPVLPLERDGEVGAEVEKLVLDAFEHVADPRRAPGGEDDADRGVELVDGAVGCDPLVQLGHPRAVAERRLPRVARSRVDAGQADRLVSRAAHAA